MDYSRLAYAGFDLCAIVINAVVLINYFVSKRMRTRTARTYQVLAIVALVSSVVNSCLVVNVSLFSETCPRWLLYGLHLVNYVVYIITGIVFLIYTIFLVYENKKIPVSAYVVISVISLISIAILGFYLVILVLDTVNDVQVMSLFRLVIYGCRSVTLIASIVYTLIYLKYLRNVVRLNIFFFTGLNLIASIVQMHISRLQISDFALSVAVLIIYISLQRPEDEIDSVTGMFNLSTFKRRMDAMLKAGQKFLIFVTELNNMQLINSTFGINAGNQVLRQAAERIKQALGKQFYLYRLDGVKFAVNFNDENELDEFLIKYEKIFDSPFTADDTSLRVNAIACVISCPEVSDKIADIDDVIKYYRSNAASTEKVYRATRDSIDKNRRYERVDYAIQNAVKNRSFKVYYQPIMDVRTGTFNCCEALLRLVDPELGFIPPDEFIPVAEQNGKIVEVGRFVIDEVCRFIKKNDPRRYGLEFIDVNLSVIQCMHPEIIRDIDKTLKSYGIPREMVNLEITETASAKSYGLLQSRLNELHSNGFTISLDDFGTGFSSVEFLINFPFDVVKLDKSLIWAYMSTRKYEPILQHYMPMLHSIGAKIVAEGVETAEMVQALKALGCDYLQGFYYSKPIPEDAFMEFLVQNSKSGDVRQSV